MKGRGRPRIGVGNGALGGERGLALGQAMAHWGRTRARIGVGNGSLGENTGPHWGRQWVIGVGKWGCFSVAGRCWGGCVVALG